MTLMTFHQKEIVGFSSDYEMKRFRRVGVSWLSLLIHLLSIQFLLVLQPRASCLVSRMSLAAWSAAES